MKKYKFTDEVINDGIVQGNVKLPKEIQVSIKRTVDTEILEQKNVMLYFIIIKCFM